MRRRAALIFTFCLLSTLTVRSQNGSETPGTPPQPPDAAAIDRLVQAVRAERNTFTLGQHLAQLGGAEEGRRALYLLMQAPDLPDLAFGAVADFVADRGERSVPVLASVTQVYSRGRADRRRRARRVLLAIESKGEPWLPELFQQLQAESESDRLIAQILAVEALCEDDVMERQNAVAALTERWGQGVPTAVSDVIRGTLEVLTFRRFANPESAKGWFADYTKAHPGEGLSPLVLHREALQTSQQQKEAEAVKAIDLFGRRDRLAALTYLDPEAYGPRVRERAIEAAVEAWKALEEDGSARKNIVRELIRVAREDPDGGPRRRSIQKLGDLVAGIRSNGDETRTEVAALMVEVVTSALDAEGPLVASNSSLADATRALGWCRQKGKGHGELLTRLRARALMQPETPDAAVIRREVVKALNQIGEEKATVVESLRDPDPDTRQLSVRLLASSGDPTCAQDLAQAWSAETHPSVRREIVLGLEVLHDFRTPVVIESLQAAVQSGQEYQPSAVIVLLRALKADHERAPSAEMARGIVSFLGEAILRDLNPAQREALVGLVPRDLSVDAISVLRAWHAGETEDKVRVALGDLVSKAPEVRAADLDQAARALEGKDRGSEAAPLLRRLYLDLGRPGAKADGLTRPAVRSRLLQSLLKSGQMDEARTVVDAAVAEAGESIPVDLQLDRARVFQAQKRREEAMDAYQKALAGLGESAPVAQRHQVHLEIARVEMDLGRYVAARQRLTNMSKLVPEAPATWALRTEAGLRCRDAGVLGSTLSELDSANPELLALIPPELGSLATHHRTCRDAVERLAQAASADAARAALRDESLRVPATTWLLHGIAQLTASDEGQQQARGRLALLKELHPDLPVALPLPQDPMELRKSIEGAASWWSGRPVSDGKSSRP